MVQRGANFELLVGEDLVLGRIQKNQVTGGDRERQVITRVLLERVKGTEFKRSNLLRLELG